jgi:hypothetical protein
MFPLATSCGVLMLIQLPGQRLALSVKACRLKLPLLSSTLLADCIGDRHSTKDSIVAPFVTPERG